MSTLNLTIYGREYTIACDDGQEAHLNQLAHEVNDRVRQISQQVGRQGEGMMLVLAALMMADEMAQKKARIYRFDRRGAGPLRSRAQ